MLYLPMQKVLKILPKISSGETSLPVTFPTSFAAYLNSSAARTRSTSAPSSASFEEAMSANASM